MRRLTSRVLVLAGLAALPLLSACSDPGASADASVRGGQAAAVEAAAPPVPAGLARADFDVAGMDCGGCAIATRAALRKLDGVERADASYDDETGKGAAWALYDPAKVTPERLMEAIRELGYTPTVVEGEGSTGR